MIVLLSKAVDSEEHAHILHLHSTFGIVITIITVDNDHFTVYTYTLTGEYDQQTDQCA